MADLEDLVIKELRGAIAETVKSRLSGYNTPISRMVDAIAEENSGKIKTLLREALSDTLNQEDFRKEIKSAFMHTLARTLMKEFNGEIEKQANALRQQPDFRARVVLAIEDIISEVLEKKLDD